jgi:sec-independent protein translocase protein TatA
MLGTQDVLIGLVLAAFFFGAKRLPEVARSLGQSMTEFKKAVSGAEAESTADRTPATPPALACPACQTGLEPDWTHCPRCGAAVASTTPPTEAR